MTPLRSAVAGLLAAVGIHNVANAQGSVGVVKSDAKGFYVGLQGNRASWQSDNSELKPGVGYGGEIGYGFTSSYGLHLGVGTSRLTQGRIYGPAYPEFEQTVRLRYVSVGLRFQYLHSDERWVPYGRVGAAYQRQVAKMTGGLIEESTSHGFGPSAAGGFWFFFNEWLALDFGAAWSRVEFGLDNENELESGSSLRFYIGVAQWPFPKRL